jgi:hypothetical protein
MRLLQGDQLRTKLFHGEQYIMELPQEEQSELELLQEERPQDEETEGPDDGHGDGRKMKANSPAIVNYVCILKNCRRDW